MSIHAAKYLEKLEQLADIRSPLRWIDDEEVRA
jgi:hypothetical protein